MKTPKHAIVLSLVLATASLAAPSALAQGSRWEPIPVRKGGELVTIGAHDVTGKRAGKSYRGRLTISKDASYLLERSYGDGGSDREAGTVSIREKSLRLQPARSVVGALRGELPAARNFQRDDSKKLRWHWAEGDSAEWIIPNQKKESSFGTFRRIIRRSGALNWVLRHNIGTVDEAGGRIIRSRQPTPNFLERLVKKGRVKTVLSLNGDQDKSLKYYPPSPPGSPFDNDEEDDRRPMRKVNMRSFIKEQGLEHYSFKLSAKRVPSDQELVGIFTILLDDSKKPILLHCTGGADRTGIIAALYQVEFMGFSKTRAKQAMRHHMWAAKDGTEIQGAYLDLYQPGRIRRLLAAAGVSIPKRYKSRLSRLRSLVERF